MRSALVALAALFCLSLAPRADTIVLTDGRVFDEISISQEDGGVLIHFEHGDVLVPNEQIETLISTSTDLIPRTEEEKARFEKGQVRYKGKWVKISQRDRLVKKDLAALREQVENAKNRRLWRNRKILETKNFIFESTCPDAVLENYADLCETYFSEFVKSWKIRKPKGLGKLTLKFFIDQEAFMQVTGMGSGVLGFFRFIEPFELCIFYDRLDPEGTEQVLYHEVGHYLMRLVEDGFKYPHWPGESISEFYSASVWDPVKKKLVDGDSPGHRGWRLGDGRSPAHRSPGADVSRLHLGLVLRSLPAEQPQVRQELPQVLRRHGQGQRHRPPIPGLWTHGPPLRRRKVHEGGLHEVHEDQGR